jgi:hypothetical protein
MEANAKVKPIVLVVIGKSTLTCTDCGKIGHLVETCHNRKREIPVVPTTIVKFIELVGGTKTQYVKSRKILVCYPYIIYSSVEHRFGEAPKNLKYRTCSELNMLFLMPQHLNYLKLTMCQLM